MLHLVVDCDSLCGAKGCDQSPEKAGLQGVWLKRVSCSQWQVAVRGLASMLLEGSKCLSKPAHMQLWQLASQEQHTAPSTAAHQAAAHLRDSLETLSLISAAEAAPSVAATGSSFLLLLEFLLQEARHLCKP